MNKTGNNEQFDADILQCKVDILRARDITPLHNNTTPKNPATQDRTRETTPSSDAAELSTHKDTNSTAIPIETIPAGSAAGKGTAPLLRPAVSMNKKEEVETLQAPKGQEKGEIPSFDLAEEIMAEQRKITAIRRKAPGQKTEAQRLKPEAQIDDHIIEQPKPLLSEQERIIAEIVARDIKRLCRGDYSSE
ncbi:MAG: hypothetical protein WAK60_08765 [Sedimentisphaerales bacterium]